jgi:uncharacterized RDD family membrane protein YckC
MRDGEHRPEGEAETLEAEILEEGGDGGDGKDPSGAETGGLPARFGALCLDVILVTAGFALFLTQFVLPEWYPGALEEMTRQFERTEEGERPPPPGEELQEALATANALSFFFVFLYFAFVPLFLGGGTLGMRIFNLRIQDRRSGGPAPLRAHLVRGAVKTICLQVFFPLLTLLFLFALRSPQRIAPHDRLAGTRVVRGPAFSRP